MNRIALISGHASPLAATGGTDSGGQNVYVGQVVRHLARLGCQVDVFTRKDKALAPKVAKTSRFRSTATPMKSTISRAPRHRGTTSTTRCRRRRPACTAQSTCETKQVGAKILQASTSEVYGDPSRHLQPESYWGHVNPIGPRACYDAGNRCTETRFMDYRRQHHMRVKIARIFNTYGPGMHPVDGRVVSNFIMQALTGRPLTVYGDGSQTRAFCYVDDMIEALVRTMATPDDFAGPVNLGNPDEVSALDIARHVLHLSHSHSPVVFEPLPTDDPVQQRPDIHLAHTTLRWQPDTALDDGLARTIRYFAALTGNGGSDARVPRADALADGVAS